MTDGYLPVTPGSGVHSMSRTEMVLAVALAAAFMAVTLVLVIPH
jgi:hypothetical protein